MRAPVAILYIARRHPVVYQHAYSWRATPGDAAQYDACHGALTRRKALVGRMPFVLKPEATPPPLCGPLGDVDGGNPCDMG